MIGGCCSEGGGTTEGGGGEAELVGEGIGDSVEYEGVGMERGEEGLKGTRLVDG